MHDFMSIQTKDNKINVGLNINLAVVMTAVSSDKFQFRFFSIENQ